MGKISGVKEVTTIQPDDLLFGDNEFETGILAVAESESDISIADGTVLTRNSDGEFEVSTDASGALCVLVDRVATPITAAGDYPVRVCIAGKVNKAKLNLNGSDLTDANADALRNYGILALDAYEA